MALETGGGTRTAEEIVAELLNPTPSPSASNGEQLVDPYTQQADPVLASIGYAPEPGVDTFYSGPPASNPGPPPTGVDSAYPTPVPVPQPQTGPPPGLSPIEQMIFGVEPGPGAPPMTASAENMILGQDAQPPWGAQPLAPEGMNPIVPGMPWDPGGMPPTDLNLGTDMLLTERRNAEEMLRSLGDSLDTLQGSIDRLAKDENWGEYNRVVEEYNRVLAERTDWYTRYRSGLDRFDSVVGKSGTGESLFMRDAARQRTQEDQYIGEYTQFADKVNEFNTREQGISINKQRQAEFMLRQYEMGTPEEQESIASEWMRLYSPGTVEAETLRQGIATNKVRQAEFMAFQYEMGTPEEQASIAEEWQRLYMPSLREPSAEGGIPAVQITRRQPGPYISIGPPGIGNYRPGYYATMSADDKRRLNSDAYQQWQIESATNLGNTSQFQPPYPEVAEDQWITKGGIWTLKKGAQGLGIGLSTVAGLSLNTLARIDSTSGITNVTIGDVAHTVLAGAEVGMDAWMWENRMAAKGATYAFWLGQYYAPDAAGGQASKDPSFHTALSFARKHYNEQSSLERFGNEFVFDILNVVAPLKWTRSGINFYRATKVRQITREAEAAGILSTAETADLVSLLGNPTRRDMQYLGDAAWHIQKTDLSRIGLTSLAARQDFAQRIALMVYPGVARGGDINKVITDLFDDLPQFAQRRGWKWSVEDYSPAAADKVKLEIAAAFARDDVIGIPVKAKLEQMAAEIDHLDGAIDQSAIPNNGRKATDPTPAADLGPPPGAEPTTIANYRIENPVPVRTSPADLNVAVSHSQVARRIQAMAEVIQRSAPATRESDRLRHIRENAAMLERIIYAAYSDPNANLGSITGAMDDLAQISHDMTELSRTAAATREPLEMPRRRYNTADLDAMMSGNRAGSGRDIDQLLSSDPMGLGAKATEAGRIAASEVTAAWEGKLQELESRMAEMLRAATQAAAGGPNPIPPIINQAQAGGVTVLQLRALNRYSALYKHDYWREIQDTMGGVNEATATAMLDRIARADPQASSQQLGRLRKLLPRLDNSGRVDGVLYQQDVGTLKLNQSEAEDLIQQITNKVKDPTVPHFGEKLDYETWKTDNPDKWLTLEQFKAAGSRQDGLPTEGQIRKLWRKSIGQSRDLLREFEEGGDFTYAAITRYLSLPSPKQVRTVNHMLINGLITPDEYRRALGMTEENVRAFIGTKVKQTADGKVVWTRNESQAQANAAFANQHGINPDIDVIRDRLIPRIERLIPPLVRPDSADLRARGLLRVDKDRAVALRKEGDDVRPMTIGEFKIWLGPVYAWAKDTSIGMVIQNLLTTDLPVRIVAGEATERYNQVVDAVYQVHLQGLIDTLAVSDVTVAQRFYTQLLDEYKLDTYTRIREAAAEAAEATGGKAPWTAGQKRPPLRRDATIDQARIYYDEYMQAPDLYRKELDDLFKAMRRTPWGVDDATLAERGFTRPAPIERARTVPVAESQKAGAPFGVSQENTPQGHSEASAFHNLTESPSNHAPNAAEEVARNTVQVPAPLPVLHQPPIEGELVRFQENAREWSLGGIAERAGVFGANSDIQHATMLAAIKSAPDDGMVVLMMNIDTGMVTESFQSGFKRATTATLEKARKTHEFFVVPKEDSQQFIDDLAAIRRDGQEIVPKGPAPQVAVREPAPPADDWSGVLRHDNPQFAMGENRKRYLNDALQQTRAAGWEAHQTRGLVLLSDWLAGISRQGDEFYNMDFVLHGPAPAAQGFEGLYTPAKLTVIQSIVRPMLEMWQAGPADDVLSTFLHENLHHFIDILGPEDQAVLRPLYGVDLNAAFWPKDANEKAVRQGEKIIRHAILDPDSPLTGVDDSLRLVFNRLAEALMRFWDSMTREYHGGELISRDVEAAWRGIYERMPVYDGDLIARSRDDLIEAIETIPADTRTRAFDEIRKGVLDPSVTEDVRATVGSYWAIEKRLGAGIDRLPISRDAEPTLPRWAERPALERPRLGSLFGPGTLGMAHHAAQPRIDFTTHAWANADWTLFAKEFKEEIDRLYNYEEFLPSFADQRKLAAGGKVTAGGWLKWGANQAVRWDVLTKASSIAKMQDGFAAVTRTVIGEAETHRPNHPLSYIIERFTFIAEAPLDEVYKAYPAFRELPEEITGLKNLRRHWSTDFMKDENGATIVGTKLKDNLPKFYAHKGITPWIAEKGLRFAPGAGHQWNAKQLEIFDLLMTRGSSNLPQKLRNQLAFTDEEKLELKFMRNAPAGPSAPGKAPESVAARWKAIRTNFQDPLIPDTWQSGVDPILLDQALNLVSKDEMADSERFVENLTNAMGFAEASRIGYNPDEFDWGLRLMIMVKNNLTPFWMTAIPRYHINNLVGNITAMVLASIRSDLHVHPSFRGSAKFNRNYDRITSNVGINGLLRPPSETTAVRVDGVATRKMAKGARRHGTSPLRETPAQRAAGGKQKTTYSMNEGLRTVSTREDTFTDKNIWNNRWLAPLADGGSALSATIEQHFRKIVFGQGWEWEYNRLWLPAVESWGITDKQLLGELREAGGYDEVVSAYQSAYRRGVTGATRGNQRIALGAWNMANSAGQVEGYRAARTVLRDYRMRNRLDSLLDRIIPIHFWSNKNLLFVGQTAVDRPGAALAGMKLYDAWYESREEYPPHLRAGFAEVGSWPGLGHVANLIAKGTGAVASELPGVGDHAGSIKGWQMRMTQLTNPALFALPKLVDPSRWDFMRYGGWEMLGELGADGLGNYWNAMGFQVSPVIDGIFGRMALMAEHKKGADLGAYGRLAAWISAPNGYKNNLLPFESNLRDIDPVWEEVLRPFYQSTGWDGGLTKKEWFGVTTEMQRAMLAGDLKLEEGQTFSDRAAEMLIDLKSGDPKDPDAVKLLGRYLHNQSIGNLWSMAGVGHVKYDQVARDIYAVDQMWDAAKLKSGATEGLPRSAGLNEARAMASGLEFQNKYGYRRPLEIWLATQVEAGRIDPADVPDAMQSIFQEGNLDHPIFREFVNDTLAYLDEPDPVRADAIAIRKAALALEAFDEKVHDYGFSAALDFALGAYNDTGQRTGGKLPDIILTFGAGYSKDELIDVLKRSDQSEWYRSQRREQEIAFKQKDDIYKEWEPYFADKDVVEKELTGCLFGSNGNKSLQSGCWRTYDRQNDVVDARYPDLPDLPKSFPRQGDLSRRVRDGDTPNSRLFFEPGAASEGAIAYSNSQAQRGGVLDDILAQLGLAYRMDDGTLNPAFMIEEHTFDAEGNERNTGESRFDFDAWHAAIDAAAPDAVRLYQKTLNDWREDISEGGYEFDLIGQPEFLSLSEDDWRYHNSDRRKTIRDFEQAGYDQVAQWYKDYGKNADQSAAERQAMPDAVNARKVLVKTYGADSFYRFENEEYGSGTRGDYQYNQGGRIVQDIYFDLSPADRDDFHNRYGNALVDTVDAITGEHYQSFVVKGGQSRKQLTSAQIDEILTEHGYDKEQLGETSFDEEHQRLGDHRPNTAEMEIRGGIPKVEDASQIARALEAKRSDENAIVRDYIEQIDTALSPEEQERLTKWEEYTDTPLEERAQALKNANPQTRYTGESYTSWGATVEVLNGQITQMIAGGVDQQTIDQAVDLRDYILGRQVKSEELKPFEITDARKLWFQGLPQETQDLLIREAPKSFTWLLEPVDDQGSTTPTAGAPSSGGGGSGSSGGYPSSPPRTSTTRSTSSTTARTSQGGTSLPSAPGFLMESLSSLDPSTSTVGWTDDGRLAVMGQVADLIRQRTSHLQVLGPEWQDMYRSLLSMLLRKYAQRLGPNPTLASWQQLYNAIVNHEPEPQQQTNPLQGVGYVTSPVGD